MPALLLNPIPDLLHARLLQLAAAHQHSVTEETVSLLEAALAVQSQTAIVPAEPEPKSFTPWAKRKLLPEYEALWLSGALSGGPDSTDIISEERDAR